MTRGAPQEDWVAYVVMLLVVAGVMLGKYLIARGDTPIEEVIEEELDEISEVIEEIEEKIKS